MGLEQLGQLGALQDAVRFGDDPASSAVNPASVAAASRPPPSAAAPGARISGSSTIANSTRAIAAATSATGERQQDQQQPQRRSRQASPYGRGFHGRYGHLACLGLPGSQATDCLLMVVTIMPGPLRSPQD